jgi:DNA-binding PadR family transcriptional regulator
MSIVLAEFLWVIKKGNKTGYKIRKALRNDFGLELSYSVVYRILLNLQQEGYLSRRYDMRRGKPYSLTEKGLRKFVRDLDFLKIILSKMST